jgi:hypothetical protein
MADDVLERARRLAAAANAVADQMSLQVAQFADTMQNRKEREIQVEQEKEQLSNQKEEEERNRNAKV